jgi:hypothetical protein
MMKLNEPSGRNGKIRMILSTPLKPRLWERIVYWFYKIDWRTTAILFPERKGNKDAIQNRSK